MPGPALSAAEVRQAARAARRALSGAERRRKSLAIAQRLEAHPAFTAAVDVGLYLALPEEVDTAPVMELCQQAGKAIWLPVVSQRAWRPAPLVFRPYLPGETALRKNAFGIPEPVGRPGAGRDGQLLDLALVPLVAFNAACDRVDMGKGFYDRTFPKRRQPLSGARLLGLAFECQKADFTPAPHDTPLGWIITESNVYARQAGAAGKRRPE